MQKSKIEYCTHVSNPIKGQCKHLCSYCYAERIRLRFKQPAEISWHPEELMAIRKRKKPATIFVGSMYDIFGSWVHASWIEAIIDTAYNCPQHIFLFLTKNPARYHQFNFSPNCWLGETITNNGIIPGCKPSLKPISFISFEPLIEYIHPEIMEGYQGIIIGAMTGPGAVRPQKFWVLDLIKQADRWGIPVFLKDNLLKIYPDLPARKELAWSVKRGEGQKKKYTTAPDRLASQNPFEKFLVLKADSMYQYHETIRTIFE